MKKINLGNTVRFALRRIYGTKEGDRVIALLESDLLEAALRHVKL